MGSLRALQEWCRLTCRNYPNVEIRNLTSSFRDGLAFCAIIHKHRPDLIDFSSLSKLDVYQNNHLAFEVAESELGIPALLDPGDMVSMEVPDRLSVITYLSQYFNFFNNKSHASSTSLRRPLAPGGLKQPKLTSPERVPRGEEQRSTGGTQTSICTACRKPVHLVQRHLAEGRLFHRSCFRCRHCSNTLLPASYQVVSEAGSLLCTHPCTANQNGRPDLSRCAGPTETKLKEKEVAPAQSGLADQHRLRFTAKTKDGREANDIANTAGRRETEENRGQGRDHSERRDESHASLPVVSSLEEEQKPQEEEKQTIGKEGKLQEVETKRQAVTMDSSGLAPTSSSRLRDTGQPVPAPRRAADPAPPHSAPRTRRSKVMDGPSVDVDPSKSHSVSGEKCYSSRSEARKPKAPPWMELIHPGPWTKLPPAPPPCSLTGLWYRRKAAPVNPFDEDEEAGEGREEDTRRAQSESDESQAQPSVVASQTWCGTSQLAEAASASGMGNSAESASALNVPDLAKPANGLSIVAGASGITNLAEPTSAVEVSSSAEAFSLHGEATLAEAGGVSTGNIDEAASPGEESGVALAGGIANLAKAASSLGDSNLAEAGGVAGLGEAASAPAVSDLAEASSSVAVPNLAEACTAEVSSLDRAGVVANLSEVNTSQSVLVLSSSTFFEEYPLSKSISEPAISSASHKPHLTDSPSPPTSLANGLTAASQPPLRPPSLPRAVSNEGASTSSSTPGHSKRTCKENPFNRKASPTEIPKTRSPRAPCSTRAPAPGHGFPLIKRKVQTDQYVPSEELQVEMAELERRLDELELRGVELERTLRNCHSDEDEDDLLVDWFTLIHEKHMLVRKDAELVYMAKQQSLEEKQADVEYELRCLLNKPETEWSKDDEGREKQLMSELVIIIEQRNHIINSLDQDRQRENEEDMLLAAMIKRKDFHRDAEHELKKLGAKFKPMNVLRMLSPKSKSSKKN